MALTIYNNIASLTSQRYLGQTNSATSKTLEKLSSGLRINHASDDASGLAISEKLRGQISGLKRASMNAQDGISMLQTGEGALQEVQNIIQRMRELAVQAANGTYTSNDRKEIQKEVDQLKSEINRISASTEFNTKKLLNGDATALWSSDSDKISVNILDKVSEGNYNINVDADPGKNYIYKTDIMTLNEGAIGAEITTAGGTGSPNGVTKVSNPISVPSTGTAYYTVRVNNSNTTSAVATLDYYEQAGSAWTLSNTASAGVTVGKDSGYAILEFTSSSSATLNYYSMETGELLETVNSASITVNANNIVVNGTSIDFTIGLNANQIQAGDKALFGVTDGVVGANIGVGGGTIKIEGGPAGYTNAPTAIYSAANTLVKSDEQNTVTVYTGFLDTETGNFNLGSIDITFDKGTTTTVENFDLYIAGGGEAATSTTKLKDIARFTTADGRNIFDNTQSLTIYGNGNSTTIYLEGDDTISDFENKLTDAIVNDLGMGADSAAVNNNLVNYVAPGEGQTSGNEVVEGTFVIQSALLGDNSELSFIGDQALIDGLSLATIQEGENSELTVKVTNAHTGDSVGSDIVNDYTLRNVVDGVEVKIDSSVDVTATWDNDNNKITFSSKDGAVDLKLHLVDNSTDLQIGANEGQAINVSIAQIDTKSLGLDDVLMVDQSSAQKAITKIDKALEFVSSTRATIGAQINRLESAVSNLNTARENLSASESRIRDLDIAEEMAKFTRNQILSQAGTAMLAQANQLPQMALQLLQ